MARTKRTALCSTAKALQKSCTAELQPSRSISEAFRQLMFSCSALQNGCAAFQGFLQRSAAVWQLSEALLDSCKVAAYGCKICSSDKFSTVQ